MIRLFLFLFLTAPVAAQSQTVLSRTVIDGRMVEILDNQTWRYAGSDDKKCRALDAAVEFCGTGLGWEYLETNNPEITAQLRFDDRNYAIIIVDQIGTVDGNSLDYMVDAAVYNAAEGAGVTAEEVVIHDTVETTLSGHPARRLVYGVDISGLSFVYSNTITVREDISVQAITYSVGTQPDAAHRNLHEGFIGNVRVGG